MRQSIKESGAAKSPLFGWLVALQVFFSLSAQAETCPEGLIDAPWRGISCIHCLHPNAPGGPQPIMQVLRKTCLKKVMTAFVIDGSFGWNIDAVKESIDLLSSDGREAWFHFYVYNGPAQRRWSSGMFSSFAVMHPATFLRRIKEEIAFQDEFRSVVKERIAPLAVYALAKGVKISVAPGLEDTLDSAGFEIALELSKTATENPEALTWIRSACFNCRGEGSQSLPSGVLREVHTSRASDLPFGAVVHTDGEYFRFRGDSDDSSPPISKWRDLLEKAGSRSNAFMLWVPKYQDAQPGLAPRSPNARTYRKPTTKESRELVNFLRGGR